MLGNFLKCWVLSVTALGLSFFQTSMAFAQAHVHGEGQLLIAQEGAQWQFEFSLPAADILGFEYAPETQAQKDKLSSVTQQINDLSNVVNLPSFCRLTDASNSLGSLDIADASGDKHSHGEHEHHDHEHDKHAHAHDNHKHDNHKHEAEVHEHHEHEGHDHSDENKHSHDNHDSHEAHADITLSYIVDCKNNLEQVQVNIFSVAPSLQTIQAQWITNKGQGAQALSESAASLRF